MKTKTKNETQPTDNDFKEAVNLLAILTESTNNLDILQASINQQLLGMLDEIKGEYSTFQAAATKAEVALETVARSHPEWFGDKKTIKTPYGSISFHRSTKLHVENEEAAIAKIKLIESRLELQRLQHPEKDHPVFDSTLYIRTKEELNLEALETLDDGTLLSLGITRVPKENFSAKPAAIDLGKAVKEAVETAEKKEAA